MKNMTVNTSKKPWFRTLIFFSWSLAMFVMGTNLSGQDGFTLSPFASAQAGEKTNPPIIRMGRERLSGNNLGEFKPYEPEYGDLIARGHDYFYSADEKMGIGVWQSKPGKITFENLPYDELMYVLDGSMVMIGVDGITETYSAGEGFIVPRGWSGTLEVPEGGVIKIWVSYEGGIKGKSGAAKKESTTNTKG